MSVVDDVTEYLRSFETVIDVLVMDDAVSSDISRIEHSIKTRTDHDYENVGYDIAMKKDHRLCIYFRHGLPLRARSILKLMTTDGTILGKSLLPEEIPEYKGRDDIIWVSDDFIVFTEIKGNGEEAFVLYPSEIPELTEAVNGCRGPISVFPTTSSDIYLKERMGLPLSDNVFTLIVAFDG